MSTNALPKISKRKARGTAAAADDGAESDASSSSSGSDVSFINVDFDFRAPTEIDEAALRRLLRQLFHTHANALNLYDITSHILELGDAEKQAAPLGTVIKVEGDEDQDPFSFVSAVRLGNDSVPASKALTSYFAKHLPASSPITAALTSSLSSSSSSSEASISAPRPYLYLHERFINLPPQTAPPLYRLLTDELTAGKEEPTHVLFLSRVFSAEAYSDDEDEPMRPADGGDAAAADDDDKPRGLKGAKRRKGLSGKRAATVAVASAGGTNNGSRSVGGDRLAWGHFRPEDVILESYAKAQETFRFPPPQEAEESYESPLYARVLLLDWADVKSGKIWEEMERQLGQAAQAAAAAGISTL